MRITCPDIWIIPEYLSQIVKRRLWVIIIKVGSTEDGEKCAKKWQSVIRKDEESCSNIFAESVLDMSFIPSARHEGEHSNLGI